jgi:hypothetical protein
MKAFILTILLSAVIGAASAQILPSFQFGAKGGVNLSEISANNTFSSKNTAGYLGGFWARFGALGFNLQPEIYLTSKNIDITDNQGNENKAKFTSIDVPVLFGGKVGAFGVGGRFYTGPVASFAIDKQQNFYGAFHNAVSLNYQDANFAWQFGAGLDIKKVSIDLRYEAGVTKQSYANGQTRINLFNLSLAYSIFSL